MSDHQFTNLILFILLTHTINILHRIYSRNEIIKAIKGQPK